ncbi:MAG TPA: HEAT repeat domain-containing protein, partial [Polyangiales bacterium]|nr:HEAT repeat domain-containing protein [Polyangiales bacterium]
PLPHRPTRRTPPPLAMRREQAANDDRPPRMRSTPPPLPTHDALVTEPHDPEPEVHAPPHFAGLHQGQMAHKLAEDELWLFARLDEPHASAFRHGADLALQYTEVDAHPVAVLSLVDQRDETYVIRMALDGRSESDQRVLEHLSRSFRARVALYIDSLYIETVTVSTLREGVAQAIQDKIAKLPLEHGLRDPAELLESVLSMPPALMNDDLPFGPARREASTVVSVWASVEQLAAWLRPEKIAEATLTYSVPRHVIDATIRRVVRAAIAFGVALPDELLRLAVEHGAASDEHSAVREQLQAFRQRIENNQNDLGKEATRKNWDRLLAAADARGVEVEHATLALSRAEPLSDRAALHATRAFEGASAAELKQKLQDPGQRLEAIRELCVRGHASAIEQVCAVLDALRPGEAAVATAQLLMFGEAAGDGLISALNSSNEAVRQCAALALGKLQLRRALLPLLKALENEDSPLHAEIARAFGDFGAPALRSVVRVIPGATRPDRLVLTLAHLANHGCAREVEKLENDPEGEVAQAARKAMARRARMEWEDLSVREQRTLTDASPTARLSQAFYAEASKVAI